MHKTRFLQKNCLLQNNCLHVVVKCGKLLMQLTVFLFWHDSHAQRIGNYVSNGSFEKLYDCTTNSLLKAKHWMGIDSLCNVGYVLSVCNGGVPSNPGTFQYPHSGQSYHWTILYYIINTPPQRSYSKNRLKSNLQMGKTYCVKFYVNITNKSTYGMDGFGVYFGDNSIDTISNCTIPLSYIMPQVQNSQGNIITDTLNWVAITGTFTASGNEKFLLLGNFLANNAVDTLMINPAGLPVIFTELTIDDVSCIEVNLPAYAGRDTTINLGDSTYIGRDPDFAIDTGCVWYRLPNTTTSIDTISGMWIKPNAPGTYTYVVRQQLECSALKWDTVVITVRDFDVGIRENKLNSWKPEIYPNPAGSKLMIKSTREKEDLIILIFDITGREVLSKQLKTDNFTGVVDLDLPSGAYLVKINNAQIQVLTKNLLIAK